MALPKVSVTLKNGGLGQVAPSDDAVFGMILNGLGTNNTPFLQPRQLFSPDDFEAWVTEAGMTTGPYVAEARRQIKDFYLLAGNGAELFVMFVDGVATTTQLFVDGHAASLMQASQGRIRLIGVTRFLAAEPAEPTLVEGIDAATANAIDEAHAFAQSYANQNLPLRVLLEAKYFDGTAATLRNLKGLTFNRVGLVLARNSTAATSCMGLLLGRLASIPVNRSIGRVKDGPVIGVDEAYLGPAAVKTLNDGYLGAIHDKGYIFLRKHLGRGGFYFNADPMATADTDDYNRLNRGRVIDKAHRIAYDTFLNELLDEVLVDEDTGKIVPTTIKQYQARIERAIDLSMTANGEISGVQAFVDPDQDILGTNTLNVDLRITPTGSNEQIKITLGLFNPQAAV
ncbi:hypothetical protein DYU11_18465 [Fibrisoma montanum]|uniref:DUF2586 family protein n=1 Tax=Fibrisoma montanum TaxID=2305895 RepID=A0A418M648_9BACT|nr:DUF2586 family protein [Fibrisoma montanum]RIV21390.1 hypothetical protein DYU11_18465 [Fibrisoma montanum]